MNLPQNMYISMYYHHRQNITITKCIGMSLITKDYPCHHFRKQLSFLFTSNLAAEYVNVQLESVQYQIECYQHI